MLVMLVLIQTPLCPYTSAGMYKTQTKGSQGQVFHGSTEQSAN